ncbi:hypothetical protein NM688_g4978 [Phlebia brevispora]|uniref:Uncharacterized protein n=1 Tax=Phlebia brevispora TaxID=194682 RepID=A0ACC1T1E4_9APHY|nr:hypothetical protein NM688_g4978 [Phlebia brevispora]
MTNIHYGSADNGSTVKARVPILLPPTVRLPSTRTLTSTLVTLTEVRDALNYLTELYGEPEIRGVRYIRRTRCALSRNPGVDTGQRNEDGSLSTCWSDTHDSVEQEFEPDEDLSPLSPELEREAELEKLRADKFERAYVVQWLTVLVSHPSQPAAEEADAVEWESLVQQAASLLADCAGAASAGKRCRTFIFPGTGLSRNSSCSPRHRTPEAGGPDAVREDVPVHEVRVQIVDLPLDNQDYSSVGAQTWGGACLLADMIVASRHEADFGLPLRPGRDQQDRIRILELGAGTGLVSLAAGKLLEARGVHAEIVGTDFYAHVLENLRHNVEANFPRQPDGAKENSPVDFSVQFLDWAAFPSSPLRSGPANETEGAQGESLFIRPFDVIYGADIIYELEHARWIKACVERLLRRPSSDIADSSCVASDPAITPRFHLVIPLRSTHMAEARTVEDVFPFASEIDEREAHVRGDVLAITGKEDIVCGDLWEEGTKEVEYVHYMISWV